MIKIYVLKYNSGSAHSILESVSRARHDLPCRVLSILEKVCGFGDKAQVLPKDGVTHISTLVSMYLHNVNS